MHPGDHSDVGPGLPGGRKVRGPPVAQEVPAATLAQPTQGSVETIWLTHDLLGKPEPFACSEQDSKLLLCMEGAQVLTGPFVGKESGERDVLGQ